MCKYRLKYLVVGEDKFFVHKKRKKSLRGIERKRVCGLKDNIKDE
jgi:hypothetical protein